MFLSPEVPDERDTDNEDNDAGHGPANDWSDRHARSGDIRFNLCRAFHEK